MNNNNITPTTSSSLKEYYVNIEKMMSNALSMINAMNQALTTSSSQISVSIVNGDNTTSEVKIPSFIYLEHKIEQIDNIISNLFNIPKSGEAWFHRSSDMFKLSLVKSNTAPSSPTVSNIDTIGFNIKQNNIFKDLVNPKTYIRLNISNLTDNIEQIYMKKFVIYNDADAEYLRNFETYNDVKNGLYDRSLGVDYEEYDSVLDLPIKENKYNATFNIEELPEESENPYYSDGNGATGVLRYIVRLSSISYTDKEDSSISHILKKGDYLCLSNTYVIYKIVDLYTIENSTNENDNNDHIVVIEEVIGHVALQTFEENSDMVLELYTNSYDKYHYVDIPLEENPNIIIFLGTIYNNVKSTLSNAIHLNLNNIYMKDNDGNFILNNSGNKVSYIEYYNSYCKNIGDMMVGITELAYPQTSNYSSEELRRLTESDELKNFVTSTLYINDESILKVTRINNHLIDDDTSESIIKLHEQRNEITAKLRTIRDNVDQVYTQLTTTDFSQESSITQESLRSKLTTYYDERLTLENQLLNIVDNINQIKGDVKGIDKAKYRIRGITDACDKYDSSNESPIVAFLHSTFGMKCELIGLDVEYKYKSISKDSTSVLSNSDVIFSDWNKLNNIERERYLKFDNESNTYNIIFSNYNTTSNIIKWNQIDIPITQGEDVIVRIRYKYNIGQPFINLYTPWSNEVTVNFPVEYTETNEISSILDTNNEDVNNSKFLRTLLKEGYQEHVSNKLVDNSQIFYHMPENIYSGFNTPENKLISLKDKLIGINNDLLEYKNMINDTLNTKYSVYLQFGENMIELSNLTANKIKINDLANDTNDSFRKEEMNLIIKNTGDIPIKLYSIFPGDINKTLLEANNTYFNQYYKDYERVPMLIKGYSIPSECIMGQHLGQWIYFRQNNPFTKESLYYDTSTQRQLDNTNLSSGKSTTFVGLLLNYINVNNKQVLLPYISKEGITNSNTRYNSLNFIDISGDDTVSTEIYTKDTNTDIITSENMYLYNNADTSNNNYILKYENLIASNEGGTAVYLTNKMSMTDFAANLSINNNLSYYNGAFFIPELFDKTQVLCDTKQENQYKILDVGTSLSVPLLFECFLSSDVNDQKTIEKTLAFDIRTTPIRDIEHYILTIEASYDYTQSTTTVQNTSLVDGLTE